MHALASDSWAKWRGNGFTRVASSRPLEGIGNFYEEGDTDFSVDTTSSCDWGCRASSSAPMHSAAEDDEHISLGQVVLRSNAGVMGYINALAELNKSRRRAVASLITERPGDEFADVVVATGWSTHQPRTEPPRTCSHLGTILRWSGVLYLLTYGTVVARRSLHRNMSEAVACTVEYFRNHVDCHAARKWNCRVMECMRPCDLHASYLCGRYKCVSN